MPKLQSLKDFNYPHWISHQRTAYKKGTLPKERIEILESLPGWSWNTRDTAFEEGLAYTKKYGIVTRGTKTPEGFDLAGWQNNKKSRKHTLTEEQISRLEAVPGWSWNSRDAKWEIGFNHTKKYGVVSQKMRTPDGFKLGVWQTHQRGHYKEKVPSMTEDKIKKLESIPGWYWKATPEMIQQKASAGKRAKSR
jgi:hypothetical protein